MTLTFTNNTFYFINKARLSDIKLFLTTNINYISFYQGDFYSEYWPKVEFWLSKREKIVVSYLGNNLGDDMMAAWDQDYLDFINYLQTLIINNKIK